MKGRVRGLLAWVACIGAVGIAAPHLLTDPVQWRSFWVTLRLGVEVTALCLVLGLPVALMTLRSDKPARSGRWLVVVALGSLLVPTIARSLAFSALFSYYGPLATLLRAIHLWPQGRPLESSHVAVVVSLVTIYFPFALLILIQGVKKLGRGPEVSATLGADSLHRWIAIILPGLRRSLMAAGLVVLGQVLGAIITPQILGSSDVTIAMLIDDSLKRTLQIGAAMRLGMAELLIAVPIAVVAAWLLEGEELRKVIQFKETKGHLGSWLLTGPLIVLLLLPVVTLLMLSVTGSGVLAISGLFSKGLTLRWFGQLLHDPGWRSVLGPSLLVWSTAVLVSLGGATWLGFIGIGSARLRRVARWASLMIIFLPQNALGLLLFGLLSLIPGKPSAVVPAWLLAGLGEALPAFGIAFLILDGAFARLSPSLRVAATLGAGPLRRLRRLVLPQLLPAAVGVTLVTTLLHLDDIIFVRYLPAVPVNTIATELFARARYTSSPTLAAACVSLWLVIGALTLAAWIAWRAPALQARFKRWHRGLADAIPEAGDTSTGA